VLNVHRGQHVDAGLDQDHDVFPAFGSRRAGNVGVGKFVDGAEVGLAAKDGIGIHLLERMVSIFDLWRGTISRPSIFAMVSLRACGSK